MIKEVSINKILDILSIIETIEKITYNEETKSKMLEYKSVLFKYVLALHKGYNLTDEQKILYSTVGTEVTKIYDDIKFLA